jgi:hypothetical protein
MHRINSLADFPVPLVRDGGDDVLCQFRARSAQKDKKPGIAT